MADYPCDHHRARYPSESHRVYLNVYRGEEKAQFKGSICGDCLAELVSQWLSWALYATPDGWKLPDGEGQPLEVPWMPPEGTPRPLNGSKRW